MSTTATAIRTFDYLEGYAAIEDEIVAAVREVLRSGSLILGPRVAQFEEHFADFLGGGHAVGVGNGTDALAIALRALDVGPNDEVITVANTAIPTVSAIRMTGALPVFCDIDPQTWLIDLSRVEECITPQTKAIVPVHLYGNAVDMPRLMQLAAHHGLSVVEDCAQSCGTTWQGRATGTFGDVGCFSFYPTKNLGAYGDGGCCVTRNKALAGRMRRMRMYGCAAPNDCRGEGVNSRLDELQAAILDVKLQHLSDYLERRRAIGAWYREHLPSSVRMPLVADEVDASYHLFVLASGQREKLMRHLSAAEIGSAIHYPTPIHRAPGYQFLGYGPGSLPVTERLAGEILTLPCYPELPYEAVRRVCSVIDDALAQ